MTQRIVNQGLKISFAKNRNLTKNSRPRFIVVIKQDEFGTQFAQQT